MHELRIHGVGPQRPASVLGALEESDIERIAVPNDPLMKGRLAMWRRKAISGWPGEVQALLWSGLTSDSRMQALWPILFPFTLLNVAGFTHPAVREGDGPARIAGARLCRAGVLVLAFLLTASWGVWFAVLARMPMQPAVHVPVAAAPAADSTAAFAISTPAMVVAAIIAVLALLIGAFGRMARSEELPPDDHSFGERLAGVWRMVSQQLARIPVKGVAPALLGVAAGVGLAWLGAVYLMALTGGEAVYGIAGIGAIGLIAFVALFTRRDFDDLVVGDEARGGPRRLALESISDRDFFSKERKRVLFPWSHVVLLLASFTVSMRARSWAVTSIWFPWGTRDLSASPLTGTTAIFLALGAAQVACLVVLYAGVVLARLERKPAGPRFRFAAPVVVAGVAVLLSNGVFASLALFLKQRYQPEAPLGAEFMVLDVFIAGLLLTLLLALGAVARVLLARRPPVGETNQRRPKDPAANLARVARLPGTMDLPLSVGVIATWLVASGFFVWRLAWGELTPEITSPFMLLALWALPAAVVFGTGMLRTAIRNLSTRQQFGQAWDVLTLWPRRFHPFAVRSYAEQVVPVLKAHLAATGPEGVVISAHSQGSVLAYAALTGLEPDPDVRFGLVSYGSPLTRLHARCFPHHFHVEGYLSTVKGAHPSLTGWVNCFHQTDPVGHEVFTAADHRWTGPAAELPEDLSKPVDLCLADPARGPASAAGVHGPPLERDRQPGDRLAVHSDYLREPLVKEAVARMRADFGEDGDRT